MLLILAKRPKSEVPFAAIHPRTEVRGFLRLLLKLLIKTNQSLFSLLAFMAVGSFYFFDGYLSTTIGWSIMVLFVFGTVLAVLGGVKEYRRYKGIKNTFRKNPNT